MCFGWEFEFHQESIKYLMPKSLIYLWWWLRIAVSLKILTLFLRKFLLGLRFFGGAALVVCDNLVPELMQNIMLLFGTFRDILIFKKFWTTANLKFKYNFLSSYSYMTKGTQHKIRLITYELGKKIANWQVPHLSKTTKIINCKPTF